MGKKRKRPAKNKLRIGDDWNAITIIALAQSNPLKAVAEFVENSIDAGATHVQVIRGKERGESYLLIDDDGEGIRKDDDGIPNFRYVATHICDSFKRQLQRDGASGIQGEFGIGLLSFWTLGETLQVTSAGTDGRNYQMRMSRNNPDYHIERMRTLAPIPGTQLKIKPLLPGIRQFSGEKLDWYLASELRDRISSSGVMIDIIDRRARKKFRVRPRQFDGDLMHIPAVPTARGEVYLELYLTDAGSGQVSVYRRGTRVLDDLSALEDFAASPWVDGHLEGIVDVPFLSLTPGTRSGVIRDGAYRTWVDAMQPIRDYLSSELDKRKRAEEERASRKLLQSLQRAFREAMLTLPVEDYDWFDIKQFAQTPMGRNASVGPDAQDLANGVILPDDPNESDAKNSKQQRDFFDYPGPLRSVRITPASCVIMVGQSRNLHAVARDKSRRSVTERLNYQWCIVEGSGSLDAADTEIVQFTAPTEPMLVKVSVTAQQEGAFAEHQAVITITDEIIPQSGTRRTERNAHGLPGYTFEHAPGSLWRSRHDTDRNLVVVNNGHRDFVYASKSHALKLRYIGRLYAKELVQRNFPGISGEEMLERMIELTLYMEDHLR